MTIGTGTVEIMSVPKMVLTRPVLASVMVSSIASRTVGEILLVRGSVATLGAVVVPTAGSFLFVFV